MEAIQKLLNDVLNIEFVQAILSNPRKKDGVLKIKVRPVEMRGKRLYQLESFTKTQAFHENLETEQAAERILSYMEEFRQMQYFWTVVGECLPVSSRFFVLRCGRRLFRWFFLGEDRRT